MLHEYLFEDQKDDDDSSVDVDLSLSFKLTSESPERETSFWAVRQVERTNRYVESETGREDREVRGERDRFTGKTGTWKVRCSEDRQVRGG